MKQRIGFIGLGIMGRAMAANVAKAGYPLVVYNRTAGKTLELEKLGAEVAGSPKDLAAQADVVILMLTGPEAIDEALWGREGAAELLDAGKTVINMSTVSPRYTQTLNQRLTASKTGFIDAPVSGTKKPAEDGTLVILAGGDKEEVQKYAPLLETMGKKVVYCGQAGQGSMMKMTINLLLGVMMEGVSEAVNFGKMGGLSEDAIFEVIFSGSLDCGLFKAKEGMIRSMDFPVQFPLKHVTKDLKFVVDTAYETGAAVPAAHILLHLYRLGVGQQWGDLDIAAIHKVIDFLSETGPGVRR